jgi:hypothetical protein
VATQHGSESARTSTSDVIDRVATNRKTDVSEWNRGEDEDRFAIAEPCNTKPGNVRQAFCFVYRRCTSRNSSGRQDTQSQRRLELLMSRCPAGSSARPRRAVRNGQLSRCSVSWTLR